LEVEVEGKTYYLAEYTFYQKIQRDGKDLYVVVDPPKGAEVDSIPEKAVEHDDGGETIYQYGEHYYGKDEESGKYVVEAPPPQEEIDSVPADAVRFEVDDETYYYVDRSLYITGDEGKYVTSEPPLGGITPKLPDGATVINEGGETFYQFDTVFFKEVQTDSGRAYEVIPAPDGSEVVEEE
ncbi:MAG: hypothetical protein KAJ12_13370, partial [Bacteroidetes bacterium]|nr:hypothetical protein [Bacteroidota bacterium]